MSPNLPRFRPNEHPAVEINLRLPSMVHGKKGFERVVWAFKNVLKNAVTWLFYDFNKGGAAGITANYGEVASSQYSVSRIL